MLNFHGYLILTDGLITIFFPIFAPNNLNILILNFEKGKSGDENNMAFI